MSIHYIHNEIFRAYDIRGIYNSTLFDQTAYMIGENIGFITQEHTICIANDGRFSSSPLTQALIAGLYKAGKHVVYLGTTATPVLYYATQKLNIKTAIMVTASHNPKDYNGFKLIVNQKPFYGQLLKEFGMFLKQLDKTPPRSPSPFPFSYNEINIDQSYLNELLQKIPIKHGLKIAWNPSNGATSNLITQLISQLPGEHILINNTIDGNFSGLAPDPTCERNLISFKRLVLDEKCDLGISFDGDGDRISVLDNEGNLLPTDMLIFLFAKNLLEQKPNATIIADVKCSQMLFSQLHKYGANTIMWKTGHSYIKEKMASTKAELAGEMSGHIFFRENFNFDDAIYAALKLYQLLSNSRKPLTMHLQDWPITYVFPEMRIACPEASKFLLIDKLKKQLNEKNYRFVEIDGVKCYYDQGWWLIRASNTQPSITAHCEAYSAKYLFSIKSALNEALHHIGLNLDFSELI